MEEGGEADTRSEERNVPKGAMSRGTRDVFSGIGVQMSHRGN